MAKTAYFCSECKKKIKETEEDYEQDPWKDF